MGAGQSSVAHVVLDKATFAHGEPVTGCVVFNTHKPVQYHSVTLTVVGKERTHWEERHHTKNGTSTTNYDGKAHSIKGTIPLLSGPGTLNPGGYRLPFAVALPDGLPPSFSLKQGSVKASITYKVKAMVDQVGMLAKDFKASSAFALLPAPPRAPAPLAGESDTVLTACCCCGRGGVAMHVEAPADVAAAGDAVPLVARVDNRSSEALSCDASVVRCLRLRAAGLLGDNHYHSESVVAHKTLRPDGAVSGGGGGNSSGGARGAGDVNCVRAGGSAAFREVLQLELEAMASLTNAQLIQVWHELRVTAAPAGCCVSSARVARPLLLCDSAEALQKRAAAAPAKPPAAPEGWRPRDYELAAFVMEKGGAARRVRPEQLAPAAKPPAVGPEAPLNGEGGIGAHWGAGGGPAGGAAYEAPAGWAAAGAHPGTPQAPAGWGPAPSAPEHGPPAGYPAIGGAVGGGADYQRAAAADGYPMIGAGGGDGAAPMMYGPPVPASSPPPVQTEPGW